MFRFRDVLSSDLGPRAQCRQSILCLVHRASGAYIHCMHSRRMYEGWLYKFASYCMHSLKSVGRGFGASPA